MAEFEVKWAELRKQSVFEKDIEIKLERTRNKVLQSKRTLHSMMLPANVRVERKLSDITNDLNKEINHIEKLEDTLIDIIETYKRVEKDICGKNFIEKMVDYINNQIDMRLIITSSICFLGEGAKLIIDSSRGRTDIWDFSRYIISSIEEVTRAMGDDEVSWAGIFLGASKTAKTYNSGLDYIGDAINKFFVDTGAKNIAKNKIAVVAKWAGTILDVALNFWDNMEEFKYDGGIQNPRFWKETVIESVLDIGLATLIGAGVVAVAGVALSPVAVAAITGVIMGVGDCAVKSSGAEEGLVEWMSDGFINIGEDIDDIKQTIISSGYEKLTASMA